MRKNTVFLFDQVRVAISNTQAGIRHDAKDKGGLWFVASMKNHRDQLNGKVVAACADDAVLEELKAELQQQGHTVEDGVDVGEPNGPTLSTLIITPGG
jgi:hypothetical protein